MEPISPSRIPAKLVNRLEKRMMKTMKKRITPPQKVPMPQKPSPSRARVRRAWVNVPSPPFARGARGAARAGRRRA